MTSGGRVSSFPSAFACFFASAYTGCCLAFFCRHDEGDHSCFTELSALVPSDVVVDGGSMAVTVERDDDGLMRINEKENDLHVHSPNQR